MRGDATYCHEVDFGLQSVWGVQRYFEEQLDFFNRWLPDDAPGQPLGEAPVRIFVMGGGSGRKTAGGKLDHGGRWREEQEWPLARAVITPLLPPRRRGLSTEEPAAGAAPREFTFDPAHPVPTLGGLYCSIGELSELLLAGRFLEGLVIGGVPAIAIAYLTEEIDPAHAARAAGTFVAGTTIGGLLGRVVSSPVAQIAGWRIGVFTVAALCGIAALGFVKLAPQPRGFIPSKRSGANPEGSLAHRLVANLRSPRQLALFAQGFLLMGGFVALYNFLGFRLTGAPFSPAAVRRQPGVRGLPRRNMGIVSGRCGSDPIRSQAGAAGVRRDHGRRRRYHVERQRLRRPRRTVDRHRGLLRRPLDRRRAGQASRPRRVRRRPRRCTTCSITAVRASSAGSAAWPTTATAGPRSRGPSWRWPSSQRPLGEHSCLTTRPTAGLDPRTLRVEVGAGGELFPFRDLFRAPVGDIAVGGQSVGAQEQECGRLA